MSRLEFEPYYCYRITCEGAGFFAINGSKPYWRIIPGSINWSRAKDWRHHIDKQGWYHHNFKSNGYESWIGVDGKPAPPPLKIIYDDGTSEICNGNRLAMALKRMNYWDTPDDFIQKYQEAKIRQPTVAEWSNNSISRHLGIFLKPEFGRYPENPKKKTFDYIHVGVTLCAVEDKKKFVQENYREIAKRVIANLEKRKGFKKYGVPINCLRVSDCTITRDDQLIFTLELKEVK